MALLQFKAPVDYEKHQGRSRANQSFSKICLNGCQLILIGAFEAFLRNYKTSPASALERALDGMNIDEDDFSDDYDFMDDDEEEGDARRRTRTQAKEPKLKYKELLQQVADRYEEEITVELDDLAKVIHCQAPLLEQEKLTVDQYDDGLDEMGESMNLVESIETNAKHYLDIMAKAVDKVMPEPNREIK